MSDIEKRVNQVHILSVLQADSAAFIARLKRYVWPSLNGSDHAMLVYYYSLVAGCKEQGGEDPDTHSKLLKKLMLIAPGRHVGGVQETARFIV